MVSRLIDLAIPGDEDELACATGFHCGVTMGAFSCQPVSGGAFYPYGYDIERGMILNGVWIERVLLSHLVETWNGWRSKGNGCTSHTLCWSSEESTSGMGLYLTWQASSLSPN